ncbi:MAG: hypothetical protein R2827_02220 [Bdellovibrionales bacterium]
MKKSASQANRKGDGLLVDPVQTFLPSQEVPVLLFNSSTLGH